jgi:hypothetical protein
MQIQDDIIMAISTPSALQARRVKRLLALLALCTVLGAPALVGATTTHMAAPVAHVGYLADAASPNVLGGPGQS